MPLEYYEIKIENNSLLFNFYNDIFKRALRKKIGFEIEKGTLTKLLK